MKIVAVCGSFHKKEIELMLKFAKEEAMAHSIEIAEVIWVPGSMEVPLALNRAIGDFDGAICLGIIEKGETLHGASMGNAVLKSIVDLQLSHNKPIGLGIIGPGAEPQHIEPRLEPHARAAVNAVVVMNNQ
ncbi:MAG TPA: 6,7-dimethyl-8-ribityllumazine synthase [Candidatus Poseidoniaceae archaeon]|jgi:6,7-dimethyl-8-ribityllumazine synthase|nr:MAG TPA: 6,7-dimethyl-8-ribityllumazine synthase [Candidatus Poseidoniales archaeon]DAC59875.1 MAG TPA: 6,7-dimethyl-8-ribityllumazine synthase [Candidatus Poseidoniales archaeon]HII24038.1 6,7-dimethyl-8-ribityllumazine synthase [Candidatus Poseidoniaceae archaeon]HII50338.1 6,7-dimethyl-8-ribityllumazine synthase [Candidatus Poseidoniaceae archaeon]|tara:strand:+ start:8828 stop:9220 length:393 start_codon:yes stop_codon:yes gene_type:complete